MLVVASGNLILVYLNDFGVSLSLKMAQDSLLSLQYCTYKTTEKFRCKTIALYRHLQKKTGVAFKIQQINLFSFNTI